VGNLDSFPHTAEENRMISDDIAGTYSLYPDLSFGSLTDQPLAGIDSDVVQVSAHGAGQNLRNF
jgi:hypothetical protein